MDWREPWLVQRLKNPITNPENMLSKVSEAFAFGGGLVNGGLSKEAMKLLRPLFSFDYMGSAEFEFGEVPKALEALAKSASKLTVLEVDHKITWKNYDYLRPKKAPKKKKPDPTCSTLHFYILAKPEDHENIKKWIDNKEKSLKESLYWDHVAKKQEDFYEYDVPMGWLPIETPDHPFIMFTDKMTFNAVKKLFNIGN